MKRAKLIVGVVAVMMAMLVAIAAPAMADHNRHNNNNNHDNDWNGWNNNDDFDDFDDFDFDEEEFFFTPFLFVIEDIDCDGFDDDFDGGIDEDAVCEVEFELVDFFD
jgi:hypothetical protein